MSTSARLRRIFNDMPDVTRDEEAEHWICNLAQDYLGKGLIEFALWWPNKNKYLDKIKY